MISLLAQAEAASPGYSVIIALLIFIAASIWLGALAQRRIEKDSFLSGYFLGNRGLGAWTMALTATVQSGGTFMGFPSLVYSHGWVVAFWIAGYMVVPLTGFAVVGKRLAQLSRRSGAITVPDLFRERFRSPQAGLIASLLILVFMGAMMVAQFKAGAIVMKLSWPTTATATAESIDWPYFIGLGLFAVTVVGYTLIGGFLASVWTDLFQSVMMLVGVMILLFLAIPRAGGLEQATRSAVAETSEAFISAPGFHVDNKVAPQEEQRSFLTPGLAVSFFFIWVLAGFGSPASMVRVMATQGTEVLRKSIFLLSVYNFLIYIPLIAICIAGRALIPKLEVSDEIVPRLALLLTSDLPGGRILTGLIFAAPFGAIMATVSCYLLVIASGLVKDIYLRFIKPHANENEIKYVTYGVMIGVGVLAIAANIRPVKYLQALVVFSGASAAATFVMPGLMLAYWRRATASGTIAAMLAGSGTMFGLYSAGMVQRAVQPLLTDGTTSGIWLSLAKFLGAAPKIGIASDFSPFYLYGVDPILWSLAASTVAGIAVSLMSSPPDEELVERFFSPPKTSPATAAIK